jgi:4-hydroxy-2-oxoheptanedioate aldolase
MTFKNIGGLHGHEIKKLRGTFFNIIPSAVVTQALASAGADAIIIDQEHAPVGPENLHAMIASTAGTTCLPLVRVTKREWSNWR